MYSMNGVWIILDIVGIIPENFMNIS